MPLTSCDIGFDCVSHSHCPICGGVNQDEQGYLMGHAGLTCGDVWRWMTKQYWRREFN